MKQKVEVFEMFTGCEMKNKYIAQNSMGQQVFYIKEDVDCCTRYGARLEGSVRVFNYTRIVVAVSPLYPCPF